jgi:hypothetical protein
MMKSSMLAKADYSKHACQGTTAGKFADFIRRQTNSSGRWSQDAGLSLGLTLGLAER